jgi:hypothetical protein
MAAIEYGSYYWCVVLNGKDGTSPGELVHLHADEMTIHENGALVFTSAGRRPAGGEPPQQKEKEDGKNSNGSGRGNQGEQGGGMIYAAFAPATWRAVYAAKLQDGTPASVEHWTAAGENPMNVSVVPASAGAVGLIPS